MASVNDFTETSSSASSSSTSPIACCSTTLSSPMFFVIWRFSISSSCSSSMPSTTSYSDSWFSWSLYSFSIASFSSPLLSSSMICCVDGCFVRVHFKTDFCSLFFEDFSSSFPFASCLISSSPSSNFFLFDLTFSWEGFLGHPPFFHSGD